MSDADIKRQAALASIFASALLTIGKLVAGLLSGSLALLSEAVHGLLDTGATILTFFAVQAADKPADDEHHYGHAKIEAVAALAETGLLIVLAIGVIVEAVRRLMTPSLEHVDANWLTFAVLIVSIVVDVVRWRSLDAIAKRTKSDALAADALHFSSDFVASGLVLAGLLATRFGVAQGDSLAAVGVALFIGIAGYRLGRRTIDTLVDAAPAGLSERLRRTVESVPGVVDIEVLRLRPAGPQVIGELSIAVPRTMPLEKVFTVKQRVIAAIAEDMPEVDLTVTANPRALDDESVLERVLLIAARRRLPVHHVTIQDVGGKKSISLDVELDAHMSHGAAHELASSLETAISEELGSDVEIETHIEPLEVDELSGRDLAPERTREIKKVLVSGALNGGIISDVHHVRARDTDAGIVVNYHCRVDPALSVHAVHEAVDVLDRHLRAEVTDVVRVVGHADPLHGAP
ncbi:MAG: Cation diffusion facilitator family transporter [Hyphomicrobiales bacterium]|nr:Cation diffusion facilitator family transporter [Hyphomicrobiales bacterium]